MASASTVAQAVCAFGMIAAYVSYLNKNANDKGAISIWARREPPSQASPSDIDAAWRRAYSGTEAGCAFGMIAADIFSSLIK